MSTSPFMRAPLPTPVLVKQVICEPKDQERVERDLRAVNMEITAREPGAFKARLKSSPSIPAREILKELEESGVIKTTDAA